MPARALAALLFALPLSAAAQQNPAQPAVDEDAAVPEYIVKPVTVIDFEGTHVDAQLVGPGGSLITVPPERHHTSMIQVRANFDDQVELSVDQVK